MKIKILLLFPVILLIACISSQTLPEESELTTLRFIGIAPSFEKVFFCGPAAETTKTISIRIDENHENEQQAFIQFNPILEIKPTKEILLPERDMAPLVQRMIVSPDEKYYTFTPMAHLPWVMIRGRKSCNLFVVEKETDRVLPVTNRADRRSKMLGPYFYNPSFSLDGGSVIYQEWSGHLENRGMTIWKQDLSTGKEKILFQLKDNIHYFHSLEVKKNLLLLTMLYFPAKSNLSSTIFLYDTQSQKEKPIFTDKIKEKVRWEFYRIRDYSTDQSRVLLTCTNFQKDDNNYFSELLLLSFEADGRNPRKYTIPFPEGYVAENALLTKHGRYCVYVIRPEDPSEEDHRLMLYDFTTKTAQELLTGMMIKEETGKYPKDFGLFPKMESMQDGLFLNNENDLLLRIHDTYWYYKLE